MSPTDVADVTGFSNQNARQTLVRMVKAGEVIKASRGRYLHPCHKPTPGHNGHKVTNPPIRSCDEREEAAAAPICDLPRCDPAPVTVSQTLISDPPVCDLVTDVTGGAHVTGAAAIDLTASAGEFLKWLRSRTEQPVNARLITSHAPKHIRAQEVRDAILQELEQRGLIRIEASRASNASRVTRLIHITGGDHG